MREAPPACFQTQKNAGLHRGACVFLQLSAPTESASLSCFLGPPGAPKARRRLKQRQICGRNHLPWAYQTRVYSGIKVCGWLHAGPLSRQHQSLHLGSVETELSQGAGAKGTLPPSSLLSAPGLEEETGFSCSAF